MEIKDFCIRVLFSSDIKEKLLSPDFFSDINKGRVIEVPLFPSRPNFLKLNTHLPKTKRPFFPKISQLDHPERVGQLLHYFANHELLALELMALALLRFPDAPLKFREGIAIIMREEQEHMQLYLTRMKSLGVDFGQFPVNDFFWRHISSTKTPQEFIASLCLTFEQANLDYCLGYMDILKTVGDTQTAQILKKVYEDEIGHVKHGVRWFEQWKKEGDTLWEAYLKNLSFPLSPNRAKGLIYSEEARRLAGVPEDFINRLGLFSRARGRPPRAWIFNPDCEFRLGEQGRKYNPPRSMEMLIQDLETLPTFLCSETDVVLVRKMPTLHFLKGLKAAGIPLPEYIVYSQKGNRRLLGDTLLSERKLTGIHPWGWSFDIFRDFSPLMKNLVTNADPIAPPPSAEFMEPLFSKAWGALILKEYLDLKPFPQEILCSKDTLGKICRTAKEVRVAARNLNEMGFERVVIKGFYGVSGKNFLFLDQNRWGKKEEARLDSILINQAGVVVEPWLDRIFDFSIQLMVQKNRATPVIGVNRMVNNSRGGYQGAILGKYLSGLTDDHLKLLNLNGTNSHFFKELIHSTGDFVGRKLLDLGYNGPVGIDAFIYQEKKGKSLSFKFKPIVEINPRNNMGRVTFELGKYVRKGHIAHWGILTRKHIEKQGFNSFKELAEKLNNKFPLRKEKRKGNKWVEGVLFTSDPFQAEEFISLLVVEPERCPISFKIF